MRSAGNCCPKVAELSVSSAPGAYGFRCRHGSAIIETVLPAEAANARYGGSALLGRRCRCAEAGHACRKGMGSGERPSTGSRAKPAGGRGPRDGRVRSGVSQEATAQMTKAVDDLMANYPVNLGRMQADIRVALQLADGRKRRRVVPHQHSRTKSPSAHVREMMESHVRQLLPRKKRP